MCATCGCSGPAGRELKFVFRPFIHEDAGTMRVDLEHEILSANDERARLNRLWFNQRNILTLNLMSSPGAGKTTLLERTIRDHAKSMNVSVIEGDQETDHDAERIKSAGCRAVQINTGAGCHLDARMVEKGIRQLNPAMDSLLMIENVGNLVCPALFDLGEHFRVVIFSVTEGEDKPLKYPHMFQSADLVVINKIDLLPHLAFDLEKCMSFTKRVNPNATILLSSAITGDGMRAWYGWLHDAKDRMKNQRGDAHDRLAD